MLTSENLHFINSKYSLYIQTLGQLRILNKNSYLTFKRSNPKRLQLLKVIIALGGKGVPVSTLLDIIWPESDGDKAFHSFEMALHRLRKDIGSPDCIQLFDGLVGINPEICTIDLWTFDKKLKSVFTTLDAEELFQRGMQLLQIYRGEFLSCTDGIVISTTRAHYRQQFLNALCHIGRQLENGKLHSKAIYLYLQGIALGGLPEALYQGVIRCHIKLDQREEAIKSFKLLEERLQIEYGLIPSSETERLIQTILVYT